MTKKTAKKKQPAKKSATKKSATKKQAQPLKRDETKIVAAAANQSIADTDVKTVQPLGADKFFGGFDDRLTELTAPGVYRGAGATRGDSEVTRSQTTILLFVGRSKVKHVPMDGGGLRVVTTDSRKFRDDWIGAPYPVKIAAEKYLSASLKLGATARAAAALRAVAEGDDMAAIKLVLDRPLAEESETGGNGLGAGLAASAKAAKKVKSAKTNNLPKGRGIGAWVCEQLLAKVPDDKILSVVAKQFPGAKTNAAHLNWYRNKMKKEGKFA